MKFLNFITISYLIITLGACVNIPIKKDIKAGYFRIKNFQYEKGRQRDYVYLMCNRKSPSKWVTARQYESGQHALWIKASVGHRDFPSATKDAYIMFNVELKAGKNYQLNRQVIDENILIWIEEQSGTDRIVVDSAKAELKRPLLIYERLRKEQCSQGTI